ncbi:MAG: hypothetical protein NTZ26_12090 [Candidatus Aminicenantes bacterium]|nr:hypothetical protein [Candidatus Aminicenantes bacterium]
MRCDRKRGRSLLAAAASAAAVLVLAAAPASAQLSAQADLVSRYIWRGFDLFSPNNGAFQPSLTYAFGGSGFSANIWISFALGDRALYRADDETDLTVTYAFKTPESLALAAGFSIPRLAFRSGGIPRKNSLPRPACPACPSSLP